jgi:ribose transport system ATP-binding protein
MNEPKEAVHSGSTLTPALEIASASKTYGTNQVLRDFSLSLAPGEIHALVGQNGSGKSSIIKILSGYHHPDPGCEVKIAGRNLRLGSPESAHELGARFVQQDLGLIDSLSIADNIFINGTFPARWATVRSKETIKQARNALDRIGLDVDPRTPVRELSPALKATVGIARALYDIAADAVKLLVLDEPTATLSGTDTEHLLHTLKQVASDGVAVLYVTHRLDEIFLIAHHLTVVRGGTKIATVPVASLDRPKLVNMLVGHELATNHNAVREVSWDTPPAVEACGVSARNLAEVSLSCRAGEVLGIAGIAGSGREELLEVLFGAEDRQSGTMMLHGTAVPPRRPDLAIRRGMGFLPPDRKTTGGLMTLTATENLTLPMLRPFRRRMVLSHAGERAEMIKWFAALHVTPSDDPDRRLAEFSGGNQQKILLAKWLRCKPSVLLLNEPTQGVDVGAKAEIHQLVRQAAQDGTAVIVASSENEELEELCSRVLVLRDGRVAEELVGSNVTVDRLARACLGLTGRLSA